MKKVFMPALILTFLMSMGTAFAEEATNPVSEMPLDEGIVIDVSGGSDNTANTAEQDVNALVTQQGEEEAAANDGTKLPLDQGNVDTTDIDSGTEIEGNQPEVVIPEEDTVVLTDKEPVVEPLAQTGIADNAIALSGMFGVLGLIGFFTARRLKTNQED